MEVSNVSPADRAAILAYGYAILGQTMEAAWEKNAPDVVAMLGPRDADSFAAGFQTAIDIVRGACSTALELHDAHGGIEAVVDFLRKAAEG